jgi:hypothetical protein
MTKPGNTSLGQSTATWPTKALQIGAGGMRELARSASIVPTNSQFRCKAGRFFVKTVMFQQKADIYDDPGIVKSRM